ncbi:MAG: InlB B-repeat-containing protein [Bacteroidota bacterium]
MISFRTLLAVLLSVGIFAGCSILGGKDDKPKEVELSLHAEPVNAGSVSFARQTFTNGDTVTVEAMPNLGFAFDNWSGSRSSQENPFEFVMDGDTMLTANFIASSSVYDMQLLVFDSADTLALNFGQLQYSTDDFDIGKDYESPPSPPSGHLHAFFTHNNLELLRDYRDPEGDSQTWDLSLQPSSDDTFTLEWSVDKTIINGSIILDVSGTQEVDMLTTQSVQVDKADIDNLSITYTLEND